MTDMRASLLSGANGEQVVRFPWVTDTFEMHPESGVVTVFISEAQAILVVVIYIWHTR